MRPVSRLSRVFASGLAVCLLAVLAMGAADTSARYNDVGHKMICMCGCNYVLLECNHVNCPSSGPMVEELRADLARGMGDNAILHAFEDKYGPTVLAAPMFTRFNMIAWILPPTVLLMGVGGTFVLVRRWRKRASKMPAVESEPDPESEERRKKIRKDTEE